MTRVRVQPWHRGGLAGPRLPSPLRCPPKSRGVRTHDIVLELLPERVGPPGQRSPCQALLAPSPPHVPAPTPHSQGAWAPQLQHRGLWLAGGWGGGCRSPGCSSGRVKAAQTHPPGARSRPAAISPDRLLPEQGAGPTPRGPTSAARALPYLPQSPARLLLLPAPGPGVGTARQDLNPDPGGKQGRRPAQAMQGGTACRAWDSAWGAGAGADPRPGLRGRPAAPRSWLHARWLRGAPAAGVPPGCHARGVSAPQQHSPLGLALLPVPAATSSPWVLQQVEAGGAGGCCLCRERDLSRAAACARPALNLKPSPWLRRQLAAPAPPQGPEVSSPQVGAWAGGPGCKLPSSPRPGAGLPGGQWPGEMPTPRSPGWALPGPDSLPRG